ncbi:MAG: gliding motility-associated C-terminal domain-containing protein [Bacteroidota bacterium]
MTRLILRTVFLGTLLSLSWPALAQPVNDDCFGAILLPDVIDWCSEPNTLSNVNATGSAEPRPSCFPGQQDEILDVWYYFIAQGNAANLRVIGNTSLSPGGTIANPEMALYSGNCQSGLLEEECISDGFGSDVVEMYAFDLIPGGIYYLRVSARLENVGTYQLCVNSYNEVPEPSGDCPTAVLLCDKSSFAVEFLIGGGDDPTEIQGASCLRDCGGTTLESGSTWYKWTCKDPGSLSFTLVPSNPQDDLDFVVYELTNGIDNCSGRTELRCMASGENTGAPLDEWEPCTGATGLSLGDQDTGEVCGCQPGNNNFAQAIDMQAGRSYALVINNFSPSNNGFTISFGGTGTFLGPEAAFRFDPPFGVECDEPVSVINESSFATGEISRYFWSFGEGATPAVSTDPNPGSIVYNSFGTKFVSLTVESESGCIVTEIIELEIEECCRLASDIGIRLEQARDPICANTASGLIEVGGTGGDPFYQYSIDGSIFQPSPIFNGLQEGNFQLAVQDIKGCRDTLLVDLNDPPELFVDAGPDVTVTLGFDTDLNAEAGPDGLVTGYRWEPAGSLTCADCPDPTATAPGTTTYSVEVFNAAGCTADDEVTVIVREDRPIYIPNAISPNGDGVNDFFTLYGGPAADKIDLLRVFNRWGALVFEGRDLALGDEQRGWDGRFKEQFVGPDVYTFYAKVSFIDRVVLLFEGSINIIR